MKKRTKLALLATAVLVSVGGTTAGTFAAGSGSTRATGVGVVTKPASSNAIRAATPLLANLVARLNSPRIATAYLAGPPTWAQPVAEPGLWAYFTVPVAKLDPNSPNVRAIWESDLIASALRSEMARRGLGILENSLVQFRLPDGSYSRTTAGGLGDDPSVDAASQTYSMASPAAIEQRLAQTATAVGLRSVQVTVEAALQPAPVVIATTADPAGVVAEMDTIHDPIFGANTFDGDYLEVRDNSGRPVLVEARSNRGGAGYSWVSPDFASHRSPTAPGPGVASTG